MNKYSKKVLKLLNKESPKLFSKDELSSKFHIDKFYENDIFQELIDNDLINQQCIARSNNISVSGENYYRSTMKGKDYFKNNFKHMLAQLFTSFFNSILCPIIVSVITTLITIYLLK